MDWWEEGVVVRYVLDGIVVLEWEEEKGEKCLTGNMYVGDINPLL